MHWLLGWCLALTTVVVQIVQCTAEKQRVNASEFAGPDGGSRISSAIASLGAAGGTVVVGFQGPDDVTSHPSGQRAHPTRGQAAWGFRSAVVLPSHVTIELDGAYLFQLAEVDANGAPTASASGFFITERWSTNETGRSDLAFWVHELESNTFLWPLYMYDVTGSGRKIYFSNLTERANGLPEAAELFLPPLGQLNRAGSAPPMVRAFSQRYNVEIALIGTDPATAAVLESNGDFWYLHGKCVHHTPGNPCHRGDPQIDPLLSGDVSAQLLRMGNVIGLRVANLTMSRCGGWATFFRDTARVEMHSVSVVSGYRDGYHMYGFAINHTITQFVSQQRDNNVALLGERVHARNVVFKGIQLRNQRVDPVRINVYRPSSAAAAAAWGQSNIVSNVSMVGIDAYENGNGDPFVMLGHVDADVGPIVRLVNISFENVRIHNNSTNAACNHAFRLVQPSRGLRLSNITILRGSPSVLIDLSHQVLKNFTASVQMVDGLIIDRLLMHPQKGAVQLGHSLPPSFANNSYAGVYVDGAHVSCASGCRCNADSAGVLGCYARFDVSEEQDYLLDIFQSGDDGYACYRIPVLFRLPDGNIALYAEGRHDNCNDLGGHTDIVFKVSADNGRTFGKLHTLYSESTETTKVTIGNPSPVIVDGKVLMLCVRNAQQLLRLKSLDSSGLVWPSKADEITQPVFERFNTYLDCLPGALHAGGDLHQANMTLLQAKSWCLRNLSCAGFTARARATSSCRGDRGPQLDFYFKSGAGGNSDTLWTSWTKPMPPGRLVATGPPGGMALEPSSAYPSGRIVVEYYTMGGPDGSSAGVLLSDDHGMTFTPSNTSLPKGGEGTIALAPNTSLIFNSRAPNSGRYQSESRDGGETWSSPRLFQTGFGSNAEGALLRMNNSNLMLFSHGGQVNGSGGRWNMTVWSSKDSADTWTSAIQCEPDATIGLHQAYSTMLQLTDTQVLVVWERGPMDMNCKGYPAPRCYPPAGEYQTLRGRIVSVPIHITS